MLPSSAAPVFVVGKARTGTTLMYRTVQAHPDMRPFKACLRETRIFHSEFVGAELLQRRDAALLDYMLGEVELFDRLAAESRGMIRWQRMLRMVPGVERAFRESTRLWEVGGNASLIRLYFRYAAEARGTARTVEKSPIHVYHLDRILSTFPDALVIAMVRHPVYTYGSVVARRSREAASGPLPRWLEQDAEGFAASYGDALRTALSYAKRRPRQVMPVKYEAFTSEPEDVFRRVCAFLHLPYSKDALSPLSRNAGGEALVGGAKGDTLLCAPIQPRNTSAPKKLPPGVSWSEAAHIERHLRGLMRAVGYEPVA